MKANSVSTMPSGRWVPQPPAADYNSANKASSPKDAERRPLLSELNDRLGMLTSRASDLVAHLTLINNAAQGSVPETGAETDGGCFPAGSIHEALARCDTLSEILGQLATQVARAAAL